MKVFSFTPGDADIAVLSVARDLAIVDDATEYTDIIPVRNRDLSSLVAIGGGTKVHVKIFLECYEGFYKKSFTESCKADNLTRVVIPEKYWGKIAAITSVKIEGDATDYYAGGSFDLETGVLTLGTPLPYEAQVNVVFEALELAASAAELQAAVVATKADMRETDTNMIWEIDTTDPISHYIDFTPPSFPFVRLRVEGQADNDSDTVLSMNVTGTLRTKTS